MQPEFERKEMETNRIVPTDNPPLFIKHAYLNLVGPIKDRRGKDKYGLKFAFSLSDNEDKPTRADGRAEVVVESWSALFGAKQKFQFEFNKADFEQKTVTGFFGDRREILLCMFQRIEPIFSEGTYGANLSITTSDDRKLSVKGIRGSTEDWR